MRSTSATCTARTGRSLGERRTRHNRVLKRIAPEESAFRLGIWIHHIGFCNHDTENRQAQKENRSRKQKCFEKLLGFDVHVHRLSRSSPKVKANIVVEQSPCQCVQPNVDGPSIEGAVKCASWRQVRVLVLTELRNSVFLGKTQTVQLDLSIVPVQRVGAVSGLRCREHPAGRNRFRFAQWIPRQREGQNDKCREGMLLHHIQPRRCLH